MANPDTIAGAVVADTVIETRDIAAPRGARPRRTSGIPFSEVTTIT